MYIESVPNRDSPPCILLRESFREGKRTHKRTIANLTSWPKKLVEDFRILLKGGHASEQPLEDSFDVVRTLPYGPAYAVVGTIKKLGLPALFARKDCPQRRMAIATIAGRILFPGSKLALSRELSPETASSALGAICGLEQDKRVEAEDIYTAMRWLFEKEEKIEKALARRHLQEGSLVLYDLTSTWYEGETCPLAERGYNRDGKAGKKQINIGLLCDVRGCPVACEVYKGSTADPSTVASQIAKLRGRFGLKRIIMVGDRGMITTARINEEFRQVDGLGWISALRSDAIMRLVKQEAIQPELFDDFGLAEITAQEDYPNERLVVCRNPHLAAERARKREQLLKATEEVLGKLQNCVSRERNPYHGKDKIGARIQREAGRYKMLKHFNLEIGEESLSWQRDDEAIAREARLDGLYVVRAGRVSHEEMDSAGLVRSYKQLANVEKAFRNIKTIDLEVRPIFHRLEDMVRAHVLVCMLAYYVDWHMREALAPMLFAEEDRQAAEAKRENVVAPAQRSEATLSKVTTKTDAEGRPVHSFQTLLSNLSTIAESKMRPKIKGALEFSKITTPAPFQASILRLLGIRPLG